MDKTYDIPLHDIKPLVEIPEYSLEYLIALGVVVCIILIGALYLFIKWLKSRKKFNRRKEHMKFLQEVNLEDTKNAAYKLTLYGHTFKDDTPRHQTAYHELFDALQVYKYKKDVENFDSDTLHCIEIYKGMIDA